METTNDSDIALFLRARAVFEQKSSEPGATKFMEQQQRSLYKLFSQILALSDDEPIEKVKSKVRHHLRNQG